MKPKTIHIISPLLVPIVIIFDASAVGLGAFAALKITQSINFYTLCFVFVALVNIVISCLLSAELFKNCVCFFDDRVEFTWLDSDNVYYYSEIEKLQTHKDSAASLKKNYVDRYSSLIIYLKDGTVATVELGMTSKNKLKKIEEEINNKAS